MSKLGISTGTIANDGTGDSLLQGGVKINSNFSEIYNSIGDGTNINIGVGKTLITTVLSSGNVGIGSTIPTSKLDVSGNGKFSGIVTALTFSSGQVSSGVGTITTLDSTNGTITSLTGTNLNYTGVSTVGSLSIGSTEVVSSSRELKNISSLDATTIATIESAIQVAPNNFNDLQITGISTFTNGPVFVGSGTTTGTESQRLQVTGGAYVSGNLGVAHTNPTSRLDVIGDAQVSGVVTATTFNGQVNAGFGTITTLNTINLVGAALSVAGITTFRNGPVIVGSSNSTGTESQRLQVTGNAYISGEIGIGTTRPTTGGSNIGIHIDEGQINVTRTSGLNIGIFSGSTTSDLIRITQLGTGNALVVEDSTNPDATPFVVGAAGSVGIGTSNPTARLHIGPGSSSANSSPLKFSQGTNLSVVESGTIEYDGTTLYSTPNTFYGRATIPTTIYNTGAGTTGITGFTYYELFPAGNHTITLPIGTYLAKLRVRIVVTGSTVSSACSFSMRGNGNAAGSFSWGGNGAILDAGATNSFIAPTTSIGSSFSVTTASVGNPRQYIFTGEGILKITTQGSIIPSYSFGATLTSGATTLSADNYIIIQSLDTQSLSSFGPVGAGWS